MHLVATDWQQASACLVDTLPLMHVLEAAESFRRANARWLGAESTELLQVRAEHLGRAWHVTWQQRDAGRDVVSARLDHALSESCEASFFCSTLILRLFAPTMALQPEAERLAAR